MAEKTLQKMVRQVEIKNDGDVFHELFTSKPHHLTTVTPNVVQNVELHHGELGSVGSIVKFEYNHDGKDKFVKHLVEAIDEDKKVVVFRALEGDLLELYKTLIVTVQVETHGENNYVTWTLEYEKLKEDVEDPHKFMDLLFTFTKDIESHHLNQES